MYVVSDFRRLLPFKDYIVSQAYGERTASFSGHLFGALWFVLTPVFEMLVYFLLVSVVFNRGNYGEYPIFVGIMTGLIHYSVFQRMIAQGVSSIVERRNIMLQVRIEPLVFVAIACLKVLLDARYYILLYGVVVLAYGAYPGDNAIWYPFVLLLLLVVSWAAALFMATAYVFLRDVKEFSQVVLRMLRYLCPVIYPLSFIPDRYLDVYFINPFATVFALVQGALLQAEFPPPEHVVGCVLFAVGLLLLSHIMYAANARRFTKVM